MRAAVVGTRWGLVHVYALRRHGVEVVALCGMQAAATQQAAREQGVPVAVTQAAALRELGVDLVCIATPPATHAEVAAACGAPAVLCEKPVLGVRGTAADLALFPRASWVNLAFAFLPEAVGLREAVEAAGGAQRARVHTTYELERRLPAADALLELAIHPWSWIRQACGAPQLQEAGASADGGWLSLRHGEVAVALSVRHEPGLRGIRHVIEVDTRAGAWRLEGRFVVGEAWRFRLVAPDGSEMPAADRSAGAAADPWIEANVRSVGRVLEALRGGGSSVESSGPRVCTVHDAWQLDAIVQQALPRLQAP